MPELCGSTTVRASIVAIAASTALPPWRSIAAPASAARGSAALTRPLVSTTGRGAFVEAVAQALSSSGATNTSLVRCSIAPLLFASDGLGNGRESVAPHQRLEAAHDPPRDART